MLTPVRSTEQGKGIAPEVPERGEDDVGVVEAEAGGYRPAVEALRAPHPVDRVGMTSTFRDRRSGASPEASRVVG
jgi:hypothetical protein